MHRLEHSQWLPVTPRIAFAFFERPENLALVTPPELGFDLLTPLPLMMRDGAVIDYTIRLTGLRWRWRTLITAYQPPLRFIDEQMLGPYSFWRHEHLFSAEGEGTRMLDRVDYALPNLLPGWFSRWLDRVYVRPQLQRIFEHREGRFAQMIGQGAASLQEEFGSA